MLKTLSFALTAIALPQIASATPPPAAPASQTTATAPASDQSEVVNVLQGYKAAIEALDGAAADSFFWPEALVYENGGVEGSFSNYLAHHLGPELHEFTAFTFEGHAAEAVVVGDVAYATETYRYRITFKDAASAPIERRGVATSVLERRDGAWRIIRYHSSSRAPRPAA